MKKSSSFHWIRAFFGFNAICWKLLTRWEPTEKTFLDRRLTRIQERTSHSFGVTGFHLLHLNQAFLSALVLQHLHQHVCPLSSKPLLVGDHYHAGQWMVHDACSLAERGIGTRTDEIRNSGIISGIWCGAPCRSRPSHCRQTDLRC